MPGLPYSETTDRRPGCKWPALTCTAMSHDDIVAPGDALQALLAVNAEHTDDRETRDFTPPTCPPMDKWAAGPEIG